MVKRRGTDPKQSLFDGSPLKDFHWTKWHFEHPRLPKGVFRNFRAFWLWITDYWTWQKCAGGSIPYFFSGLWKNAKVFFSPWFHWRRMMLVNFYNQAPSKLLWDSPSACGIRNSWSVYYEVRCFLWFAKLVHIEYYDEAEPDKRQWAFGSAISMLNASKEEVEAWEKRQKTFRKCIETGWCFNKKQALATTNRFLKAYMDEYLECKEEAEIKKGK